VPKHRGLTVFAFPIHQPGVDVQRIEMLNGSREFTQEFITDLRVPDSDRVGEVDDGWTIGRRWMFYERSPGISFHTTRPVTPSGASTLSGQVESDFLRLAKRTGRVDDPVTRELIGEGHALGLAISEGTKRIGRGVATGRYVSEAASMPKILNATLGVRQANIRFALAGAASVAWEEEADDLGAVGVGYLLRQAGLIGGGTVEMSRNVVSERVMGMPRERADDRGIAFREVPKGPAR
jgi:alkylation response protein AidB-like acyl-CoA dehydrogenase